MIAGIDVSHWQNEIDWKEVARSGVRFAFIKATEFPDKKTSLFVDHKCQENIQGAKSNGIHWSAYHFFRTHIDPITQAQSFCETVGDFESLPPVLDLEAAGSKGERLNHKVRKFLEEVEQITGRIPIIYTSGGFWRSYMAYEKLAHTDWAREYPLWMANYTSMWPLPLYPWVSWDFWQYSDKGKLPGIKTYVDLNWFFGSEEELIEGFIEKAESTTQAYYFDDGSEVKLIRNTRKNSHRFRSISNHTEQIIENQADLENEPAPTKLFTPLEITTEPKYTENQQNWIRQYFF